jgi:hypothetical protein
MEEVTALLSVPCIYPRDMTTTSLEVTSIQLIKQRKNKIHTKNNFPTKSTGEVILSKLKVAPLGYLRPIARLGRGVTKQGRGDREVISASPRRIT